MEIELTADPSLGKPVPNPTSTHVRGQGACPMENPPTSVPRNLLGATTVVPHDGISIRLPSRPDWRACGSCAMRFHATGPTGYRGEVALCDPCTLEHSEALGSLLFLGMAVRAFVEFTADDREERYRALDELGVVARVYERMVAPWGPSRTLVLAEFLANGEGTKTEATRTETTETEESREGEEPVQG